MNASTPSEEFPTPDEVFGHTEDGRARVFALMSPSDHPARRRGELLVAATSAAEDLNAALLLLKRDAAERFIDLNIARLYRAEERLTAALQDLDIALLDAPVPKPQTDPLPPLAWRRP